MNIETVKKGIKDIKESLIDKIRDYLLNGNYRKISSSDLIKVHTICGNMMRGTRAEPIEVVVKFLEETITDFIATLSKKLLTLPDQDLLAGFQKETESYLTFAFWTDLSFQALSKLEKTDIIKLCQQKFKDLIAVPLKSRIYNLVNIEINNDRDGKIVDKNILKKILRTINSVDIAHPTLEKEENSFVMREKQLSHTATGHSLTEDSSNAFYSFSTKELLSEWIDTQIESLKLYISERVSSSIKVMSAPEFIKYSLIYCIEEDNRKGFYLPIDIHKKVDQVNYQTIIKNNLQTIQEMESGLKAMFVHDKKDELSDVYDLYIRLPGEPLKSIRDTMKDFIIKKGEELYKNQEIARDPLKFVPELIKFKSHIDGLVSFCFKNNTKLIDAKNKAFTSFMNKEHYSKQLSNYCDYLFKMGFKGKKDDQIEEELRNVNNIFKCISNKIIFQYEYVKKLSERMLNGKSCNIVAEKNLISMLKADQGMTYVDRMTQIFEDLDKSSASVDKFKSLTHKGVVKNVVFNCQVLRMGAWEIDKNREFQFDLTKKSPLLRECQKQWEAFYKQLYNSYTLKWVNGAGSLEVETQYLQKKCNITMTLVQYCTLIYLESKGEEKIPIEALSGILDVKVDILLNDLTGLLYNPVFNRAKSSTSGIITASVKNGEELTKETKVGINKQFAPQNLKLNALPVMMKKVKTADKEAEENEEQAIKKTENHLLDCAITRIMKGRIGKLTTHLDLVNEVVKQIETFKPQPDQIKFRIEALIDKGIMKRVDGHYDRYEYTS